jgi:hypothetical protein
MSDDEKPYKSLGYKIHETPLNPFTIIEEFREATKDFFKERSKKRFMAINKGVKELLTMNDEEFMDAWHFFKCTPVLRYIGTEKQWRELVDRLKQLKLI